MFVRARRPVCSLFVVDPRCKHTFICSSIGPRLLKSSNSGISVGSTYSPPPAYARGGHTAKLSWISCAWLSNFAKYATATAFSSEPVKALFGSAHTVEVSVAGDCSQTFGSGVTLEDSAASRFGQRGKAASP